MELQSLSPESHSINVEIESEESRRKKVKKSPSVRFAPQTSTSSGNRLALRDSEEEIGLEKLTDADIKSEIYSILPSNTIQRNKFATLRKVNSKRAHTFPRKSATDGKSRDIDRERPHSFVTKKPSFLSALQLPSLQISDSPDGADDFEEFETIFTENERRKELENIKTLPVQMSQKKKYRDAILDSASIEQRQSLSSKVHDSWKSTKLFFSRLELWQDTLKRIEGLHGTGVVSYFVFLRWLIILNLVLFILYFLFITAPYVVFPNVPLRQINIAPNETAVSEDFLNKFSESESTKSYTPMTMKKISTELPNEDIISDLSNYLNKYSSKDILDISLNYDKKNYTIEERRRISAYCAEKYRKEELAKPSDLLNGVQDLLQGTGWLQSTILFLGFYPAAEVLFFGHYYHIPVAVLSVFFFSFVVCLVMMVLYSSTGVHETILTRKNNYMDYTNILFCSWEYCIENKKSSIIRQKSISHELKSSLAEERRKREVKSWSKMQRIRVYFLRIIIHIFVLFVLCGCYYLIFKVVTIQLKELQLHRLKNPGVQTLFVQYLTPIVITGLNIFVPIIFNAIVRFESYNTHSQINIALIRIVFLRLSSVFVLVALLYQQITCEPKDMCKSGTNETCRSPICWETYVGQQLYKLAVTDFLVYLLMFVAYDLPRDLIVRRCKNKVTQLVGRQVFDLPNQVLSLVYSQTLCWLGVIYSPLLPALTLIKFFVLFHVKKIMVLKFCSPPIVSYKASRSNAMFMIILMLSFFSVMIIHGYSLTSIELSPACSPFRYYYVVVDVISDAIYPQSSVLVHIVKFVFSGVFLLPAIILLCIAIYYYWTIVTAHRKMIKVLKAQIVLEGRDKQFLLNRLALAAKGHID